MSERVYIAIDLKSFYASVECRKRGLDPLRTNLVVADVSRTDKTICLAVSPALKSFGIPGRPRLYEVKQDVAAINRKRRMAIHGAPFHGVSTDMIELQKDPYLKLGFIAAKPHMAHYIEISTKIYDIYLKYISMDDIHVYSIDELFMDATDYLEAMHLSARQLAVKMIHDVLNETGITATAGIGTNLFLCKCAMDIVAKHIPADKDGVRIACLDEMSFRRTLWTHKPLTDFWRVGHGIARRLEANGMYTMGDVARCSLGKKGEFFNEDLLYSMFGINAELLIDHAWGYEPCTMADIKGYAPSANSLGAGQVLMEPYSYEKAGLIVKEMSDSLALDLTEKHLVTYELFLGIGYDASSVHDDDFDGNVSTDWYGRKVPSSAHGSVRLDYRTNSAAMLRKAFFSLYEKITNPSLKVRRVNLTALNIVDESKAGKVVKNEQTSLFDSAREEHDDAAWKRAMEKEHKAQEAILKVRQKYGKNAVVKGMDLEEGATGRQRNAQIGGHKA